MKKKEYEKEMRRLQGELVAMQEWVKATGAKVCIVFEGLDSAGKGGTIRRITERTSPRVFKHIALPTPTEREKSQMYIQRYIAHFPAAGEVAIFDRSWYNRAGVEPVMGYCTPEQSEKFIEQVPAVEKAMVDNGIILIKYWLNVSVDEQTRRLENRIEDPRKIWKLSPTDLKSYSRHYDYCRARDAMLAATDTGWAPWYVVDNNDKKRGRLNIISHLLSQIPYEPLPSKTSRCRGSRAPGGTRSRICPCTTSRRPSRSVDGTSRRCTEKRGPAMTDKTVVSSSGAVPTERQGEAEKWYALSPDDVAQRLGVDPASGLSAATAAELLKTNGPNALPAEKPPPGWKLFLAQYKSYMQIILVAAAIASIVIGEIATGVAVLLITALNALGGCASRARRRAR